MTSSTSSGSPVLDSRDAVVAGSGGKDQSESTARNWVYRIVLTGLVVGLATTIVLLDDKLLIGFVSLLLMFVLLFMRLPIAFALAVPGLIGLYSMLGVRPLANLLGAEPITAASNWSLSVLPMFVLMGLLLSRAGLTTSMYDAARSWFGWLPGGLGVGTNMAGAGLAAVSGSTVGTTYALARVGVPEMFRAGYKKPIVIGSVIVAGLPGQLIPPSIFLIVVAGIMENPVGPQLLAGIVPGLMVAVLFSLMIVVFSIIRPSWGGRGSEKPPTASWGQRWSTLISTWPLVVLMIIVIGGMFGGLLTATEAGAAGAASAIVFLLWFKRKNQPGKLLVASTVETVSAVGSIFLLLVGAHILTALVVVSGMGRLFSTFVVDAGLGRIEFLILVMVVYIILGMFMDPLAILLTTIPLLLPVLTVLDINPLWFGVFAVFMGELAILTPPVGILSFIIHKLLQDPEVNLGNRVTLTDVFKAVMLFLPMAIIVTILWIAFPDVVTWLPDLSTEISQNR